MSDMCGLDRLLFPYRERQPIAAKRHGVGAGDSPHLAPTPGWNILSFQDINRRTALKSEFQGIRHKMKTRYVWLNEASTAAPRYSSTIAFTEYLFAALWQPGDTHRLATIPDRIHTA
jgi:hypothetical protein